MEGTNVGAIMEKSPKQSLTNAKDVTIELSDSPYINVICVIVV